MSRLNSLFEEDIAMQDALADADMVSDSEDIVLGIIDSRYNALKDSETHLFDEKEEKYNEDGLTDEEENQINMALLDRDEDDLFDDIDEDDDL